MQAQKQFFTGDFGRQLAHRQIGNIVFGIEIRPIRHLRCKPGQQVLAAVAVERGDHEGLLKVGQFIGFCGQSPASCSRAHLVDLVEHQNSLLLNILARPSRIFSTSSVMPRSASIRQRHNIGILGAAPGGRHHRFIELAPRAENARRIDENDLGIVMHGNAANDRARRLHLVGDDGNLGADQLVHQGRFAGIGRTDQGDKSGAVSCAAFRCTGVIVLCQLLASSLPICLRAATLPAQPFVQQPVSSGLLPVSSSLPLTWTITVNTGS